MSGRALLSMELTEKVKTENSSGYKVRFSMLLQRISSSIEMRL